MPGVRLRAMLTWPFTQCEKFWLVAVARFRTTYPSEPKSARHFKSQPPGSEFAGVRRCVLKSQRAGPQSERPAGARGERTTKRSSPALRPKQIKNYNKLTSFRARTETNYRRPARFRLTTRKRCRPGALVKCLEHSPQSRRFNLAKSKRVRESRCFLLERNKFLRFFHGSRCTLSGGALGCVHPNERRYNTSNTRKRARCISNSACPHLRLSYYGE